MKVNKTRGVCRSHCGGLAVYIKKYRKAKEEEEIIRKRKYFTMQKYNLPEKKSSQRNQNPSRFPITKMFENFQKNPAFSN
jgi:hypothetical protein